MSLLLEALKKAELAKQIAKAQSPSEELQVETAPSDAARPVFTREKLPDIGQPLEILTDDLPSSERKPAAAQAARPELSLEPDAFEPPPRTSAAGPAHLSERSQAQQLFQVKEMDYHPRRPFYLTLGTLAVVAVGYGGYVWWQMRPHYNFAQAALAAPSVAPAAQKAAAAPPGVQASAPAAAAAEKAPANPVQARTAVPGIAPIQPARPTRARSQRIQSARAAGQGAGRTEPSSAMPLGQTGEAPIAVNAPILSVDPLVEQGYQAFRRNDLAAARESYQRALAREPNSRDALLGLAAVEVRSGQLAAAESRYLKLLEIDPRDTQAVAALVSLRGRLDPVASESRLKILIATQPEAAHLHFSLGNQYAQQSRWSEAQVAYSRAYSIDPDNADYAFNLAVSLDQLRQRKPALQYYERALVLFEKRAGSFPPAQARLRIQELNQ